MLAEGGIQEAMATASGAGFPRARIIGVLSNKGGVGKSTAAVQVAAALVRDHQKVLLVDADANCSASHLCGCELTDRLEGTIGAVMLAVERVDQTVQTILPGLDLLRGTTALRCLEMISDIEDAQIATQDGHLADWALSVALTEAAKRYDYVLIDCSGGHPKLIRMTLLAAHEVIVPCGPSLVDVNGTAATLELIREAQVARDEGGLPTFLGFLPNGTDRLGLAPKIKAMLDEFGLPYFSPIRNSGLLKRIGGAARTEGRFLVLARPKHPVAQGYLQVAREIEYGIGQVPPELMAVVPEAVATAAEPPAKGPTAATLDGRRDATVDSLSGNGPLPDADDVSIAEPTADIQGSGDIEPSEIGTSAPARSGANQAVEVRASLNEDSMTKLQPDVAGSLQPGEPVGGTVAAQRSGTSIETLAGLVLPIPGHAGQTTNEMATVSSTMAGKEQGATGEGEDPLSRPIAVGLASPSELVPARSLVQSELGAAAWQ